MKDYIEELLDYVKTAKTPLTTAFKNFGELHGKSAGTIRNEYYSIIGKGKSNRDFYEKYLKDKEISVNTFNYFTKEEELDLLEKVLIAKSNGSSVRSAVLNLANNDTTLFLRLQNKYRSLIKNEDLIKSVKEKLISSGKIPKNTENKNLVNDMHIAALRKEINSLFERVSLSVRRENEILKIKLKSVITENEKLKSILFNGDNTIKNYFIGKKDEELKS